MDNKHTYLFAVNKVKSPTLFNIIIYLFPNIWVYHTTEQPNIAIFYK